MMFQKHFNIDMPTTTHLQEGIILIDIMIALALATLFVAVISEIHSESSVLFYRAHYRDQLMSLYSSSSIVSTVTKPFGNDRMEQERIIGTSTYFAPVSFNKVYVNNDEKITDSIGTPLCSVDFFTHTVFGSQLMNASTSVTITPILLPIQPSLPLTDFQIRNGIAYISADSNVVSDPDIFVVDIGDTSQTKLLSEINTGPGLQAISLAGNHVFAAATSVSAQLHVIRLDSLNSLVLEKKFKIPVPFATATAAFGSAIFFASDRIYLGTEKSDGNEFNIIDVSVPSLPLLINSFKTNTKINSIWIQRGLAYIADSDENQLRIIDVSDPLHLSLINTFSPSGWNRQEGKTVSMFENNLDFARTSGGYNISTDPEVFDFSSSSVISLFSYKNMDISGGVYGVIRDRSHIYLATRQIDKEFQIFDQNFSTSTALSFSLPVAPQKMMCDGDNIYILAGTAPVIYRISFI